MDDEVSLAFALAKILIEGRTLAELTRMQILLQAVSSLISAEIGCQRLKTSTSSSQSGTRE